MKATLSVMACFLAFSSSAPVQAEDAQTQMELQQQEDQAATLDADLAPVTQVKLQVMDKMFMPDKFTAKMGQKVVLTLQSLDGPHGIWIAAFNFKLEVGAKETKTGEFTPDKDGKFLFEDTTDASNQGTLTVKP